MDQSADPMAIRTAPPGQFRIVHEDARDHWPTVEQDCRDLSAARAALSQDWALHAAELVVYDDKGHSVPTT